MIKSIEQQVKKAAQDQFTAAFARELQQAHQNLVAGKPVWTGLEDWQPQQQQNPQQQQPQQSVESFWDNQLDRNKGNPKKIIDDVERRTELGDNSLGARLQKWLLAKRNLGYSI